MSENQPAFDVLTSEQEISKLKQENAKLLSELNQAKDRITTLTVERDLAEKEAATDKLTGLPNRRMLDFLLDKELKQVNRGSRLLVVILDLDHFKGVNDSYGHLRGDQVLKEFANKMSMELRGTDILTRFGGEEFVALVPLDETDTPEEINDILKRYGDIARSISRSGQTGANDPLTVSGGGLIIEKGNQILPEEVLNLADSNLYTSKTAGRNQFTTTIVPSPS